MVMDVSIAIGATHRFELREALLIYTENRNSAFITRHVVIAQEAGPPTLAPAQPLTTAFVESLVRSLGGETKAEVLPEQVLAKTDRMICWWTPARERQMFYDNAEGKCAELNGKVFLQPPLVWRVSDRTLSIRALTENKRPHADTKVALAPFWNLSDRGLVCTGSMRCPSGVSISTMKAWEKGFYESAFTHANVGEQRGTKRVLRLFGAV
jgi:PRTRC genetic system protein B